MCVPLRAGKVCYEQSKGWGAVAKGDFMKVESKLLADIVPYAKNAKKHDNRQINNVVEQI